MREELIELTREFVSVPSECKREETYRDISSSVKDCMEDRGIKTHIVFNDRNLCQGWDITLSGEEFPHQSFSWFSHIDETLMKGKASPVEKYNVLGEVGDGEYTIVLHAHMDTRCLGKESWEHPPFSGDYDKGCIWGLGAADNKSGIASALVGVEDINLEKVKVILAFTADEEGGGYTGMGYLTDYKNIPANLVLSTNGPFYKVNVGCWGRLWGIISVEDKDSPENEQLYTIMRKNVHTINKEFARRNIPLQAARFDKTADKYIMVTCNILGDEFDLADLYSVLHETTQIDFGMKVLGTSEYVVSRRNPLFEQLSTIVKDVLGEERAFQVGPASDIRFPIRRNIDAAAFGPICKDSNVHKPEEHVRIDDLVMCTKVYRRFILEVDNLKKS